MRSNREPLRLRGARDASGPGHIRSILLTIPSFRSGALPLRRVRRERHDGVVDDADDEVVKHPGEVLGRVEFLGDV